MAQIYEMPPDTREREKIVGGLIDAKQLIWLVIGAGLCALTTIALYFIMGLFSLIFGLGFLAAGCIFAFKKKEGLMLYPYLKLKHKYKKTIKHYVNAGVHETLTFKGEEE